MGLDIMVIARDYGEIKIAVLTQQGAIRLEPCTMPARVSAAVQELDVLRNVLRISTTS